MAQKSSKQRAEEAVLDLKGKLRQLNKALAAKGAVVAENAPLVATVKAVEGMKEQAVTMTIFSRQQFGRYVDEKLPPMRISDRYKPAFLDYCFTQNRALKALPIIENIEMAVNMSSFASECVSLKEVSLGALTNATDISGALSGCISITSAAIEAAPKVANAAYLFSGCKSLKEVSIDLSGGLITNFMFAFNGCSVLRRVTGIIDLSSTNSVVYSFNACTSLEEVRIKGLKVNLDLSACAKLSVESVRYLIENAQSVSGQQIDLNRALLNENEEELGDLGDTASDKGWTINYK